MKKLKTLLLFCCVIIFTSACKKSEIVVDMSGITPIILQGIVDTNLAQYKRQYPGYPGGIAMEVISRQGTWFVSSGMGANTTRLVHFRAASNTKTLTATAILLLYQQGKLDITKKITDTIPGTQNPYIPATPEYNIPFKSSITIFDLLHHRAGVFDVSNNAVPDTVSVPVPYKGQPYLDYVMKTDPEHTFTFDELVNVNAVCRLYFFPPGTSYHYSNTGYTLLGKIIERVSGKSYAQFVTDEIMKPAGMTNSSMPVLGTDRSIPSPFATGYTITPGSDSITTLSNVSANVAEGNLITTPDDLGRFLSQLLSGNGVLNPHTVNSVMMNCLPTGGSTNGTYGCGLTYTNNLGYGHTGAHEGYLSQMVCDPGTGVTIVTFTNALDFSNGLNSVIAQMTNLLENTCYQAKAVVAP
ncbi:MAG: serine hydrolase [Bacteroidetes bacterium]|nr:serine hydrolase [Bacteroidota bacterium]